MKSTLKYALFASLAFFFVVIPGRAQNPKDCATLTATVVPGFMGGQISNGNTGASTATDGNGLSLSAVMEFNVTCQSSNGAPITSGSTNPVSLSVTSQDTIPIGCAPGSPSPPPPGGCTAGNGAYCQGVFNYPTLAECYKTAAFNGLNRLG